ncbi:MAG: hypothetical protein E3J90_11225 [Promethearchaeota archaeon]|nr:MAG: hypothetical protein E3J90_11225 [Candidatus Lokiarchaeota archaeon]
MNLELVGALLFLVNVILSVSIALIIINKLYISKKFSKEKDFHFYNDLFSWEIFFFIIAIENIMKILSVSIPLDFMTYDLLLRIRILLLFFPFWNKIIHLEKVMNKITYKRHYLAGIIPFIMILLLSFTSLPNIILICILTSTSFIPYLVLLILLKNTGISKQKSLKIFVGVILIGLGSIFKSEIFLIELLNITSPIILIIGTIFIFDSFRKEIFI